MNNIALQRKKLGLTQAQLASVVGWKPSRLSNYELSIRTPTLNDCRLIVTAFKSMGCNCTLDDVFPHPAPAQEARRSFTSQSLTTR
ncbi:XRE family transcriptional regulator [Erwinia psidii]|uniref:helix-turn-helix transcriptional regulator n=1 Tax=Erwinia psidii TaxID=69224 RepID=UPI00226BA545|nr:helix-turn-helix transcriptional regulator [Erwinia psidii]MCX8967393.1 XRE family transcriptional regulator [Erwinia psidii]